MLAAKPKPILIVTILLVVLALLSITSQVTGRLAFGRRPAGFNANGANFQGGGNAGGANAGGGGNFQGGGNGGGGNAGGANAGGGGNFQGGNNAAGGIRGGNNAFGILRNLGLSPQVFVYLGLGTTIIGILLALFSAYGVWRQKRWGLNLGMIIAIIFLIGALPGLFSFGGRNPNLLRESITILSLVASVPILVYGILPSVRDLLS